MAITERLRGLLKYVSDEPKHGMIYLCLLLNGETQPKNARGFRPLRSFILTKSATVQFLEEFGEEIMDGDLVEADVVTEDVMQDLADGKGLKGQASFKCVSLTLTASQLDAIPSGVSAQLNEIPSESPDVLHRIFKKSMEAVDAAKL
jgi:hypothetical protein